MVEEREVPSMQHKYEVRFYTGDSWGRGCASGVSFTVYGSQYILESRSCVQREIPAVIAKRGRAVQYAAARADPASRKANANARDGNDVFKGPPPEKRNVFELFSKWLKTSGGAAQIKQLLTSVDESADGVLAMGEVKQLLVKAIPTVSDLEAQLFVVMVDVNGDGMVSEGELLQSVSDCAGIDAVVAAGGGVAATSVEVSAGAAGSSPAASDMVQALEGLVQHLRSNVPAVDAKVLQLNPVGGYLTFAQLNELFQEVVPEDTAMASRDALRVLMAHVARTANISASDPGVPVMEFKRCFGLQAATAAGGLAAVAAGWVPGRPRDIFKLLRYHFKHNRAQLDELYPHGSELSLNQVRHLVRQILDSRAGEPPLTGREARHLVAVLDANGNGTLSREEFNGGLKECRDISAAMAKVRGSGIDATTVDVNEALFAAGGEQPPLTWGDFLVCIEQLHEFMVAHHEDAEAAWKRNDSRGKGRIDACELQKVLLQLAPGLLSISLLRSVLIYVDGWDPSEHALLSRKHFLMALRKESTPTSLQPPASVPLATVSDGATAMPAASLLGLSQRLTSVLYGNDAGFGLPEPELWRKWHGNIKTPTRPSGTVTLGGLQQLPASSGFWKAQWKWHTAWLGKHMAYSQAMNGGAPTAAGPEGNTPASTPGQASAPRGALEVGSDNPPNGLEYRLWQPVPMTSVPFLCREYNPMAEWMPTAGLCDAPEPHAQEFGLGPPSSTAPAAATSNAAAPAAYVIVTPAGTTAMSNLALLSEPVSVPAMAVPPPADAVSSTSLHVGGDQLPDAVPSEAAGVAAVCPSPVLPAPPLPSAPAPAADGPAPAATNEGGRDASRPLAEAREEGPDSAALLPNASLAPQPAGLSIPTTPQTMTGPAALDVPVGADLAVAADVASTPPGSVHDVPTSSAAEAEPHEPVQTLFPVGGAAAVSSPEPEPVAASGPAEPPDGCPPDMAANAQAMPRTEANAPPSIEVQIPAAGAAPLQEARKQQAATLAGNAPPETRYPLKAPPLLSASRVLLYEAVLKTGEQLGNLDTVCKIKATSGNAAWYLEKVELHCTTSEPPLVWVVHVRQWLQPSDELPMLRADPCVWEEWDMQADYATGARTSVLYLNRNLEECFWKAPPPSPLPALPGALPHLVIRDPTSHKGQPGSEWLLGATPSAVQMSSARFLDTLRKPPIFRATRVRPHYELGFGGELGIVAGQQVRVSGQTSSHSIAVQARGGFKWVDPNDASAVRLLPAVGNLAGATYGRGEVAARDDPFGGGLFPGVRECVVLTYDLDAAAEDSGETYAWLYAHVALDDSSGRPPAPVRFSIVKDGVLAWAKWVSAAGEASCCAVCLVGCRQLDLVVESDFSGGARCVWLDPCLICGPLHDKAITGRLEMNSRENEVDDAMARDLKVTFVREAGGALVYMAPTRSVPPEVVRTNGNASYWISIFTGAQKNSGTRGKVYLRLHGRRGAAGADGSDVKSNLICVNQDGAILTEGDKHSLLEPVTLPFMEDVDSVALQHVPAPAGIMGGSMAPRGPNDWNVQHIEVSCAETGRTWYFVANGWFMELAGKKAQQPTPAAGSQAVAKLDAELIVPRVSSDNELKVVFHIMSSGKGVGMGIDGDVQMVLLGMTKDGYTTATTTLSGHSIDHSHETRLLSSPIPLGELQSIELSCRQKGLLSTRLQCIEVVRLRDGKYFLFLPPNPDPNDPPDLTSTRLVLRVATQPYFRISTFTSAIPEASTDARIYIDLFGARGKVMDLYLRDVTGDSFNEGCEDIFFFPDPGLGDLGSVCISHDDSGQSPNWHLDRVEVTNTGNGRTAVFVCKNWIGLQGADRQGESQLEGRFSGVLERVLYPTHVLAALKDGQPLLRYHVVFHMDSPRGEIWHTAEALQLVGQSNMAFQFSDIVILDTSRIDMDLELDLQYVRHIQAAESRRAAGESLAVQPPPSPANLGARTYQVVLKKLAIHQQRANISMGASARQLALVVHGSFASCRPIVLGVANSVTIGVPPFSAQSDDVFQVTSDTNLGTGLLRLDIRLPSSAAPDWGILLQSVTIRDVSDTISNSGDPAQVVSNNVGHPTEFFAGQAGQWVGASPDSRDGAAGGTQALHLLPAGTCAVSFIGRSLHELAALHLRHDSPATWPGWALRCIDVLTSPPAGAPVHEAVGSTPAAAAEALNQSSQPLLPVVPALYHFPVPEKPSGWPSSETPYIRHFLTAKYLAQPFPVESYFMAPVISLPPPSKKRIGPVTPDGPADGRVLAPVDAAATAALAHNPDPERLQALIEEYSAQLAAYKQLAGPGHEREADVFTILRARIRAEPRLLATAFSKLDHDRDGRLNCQQVLDLLPVLLPQEVQCTQLQLSYLTAMLTLGSDEPLSQGQLTLAMKSCRSAYKEAAAMTRMTAEGGSNWYEVARNDGMDTEMTLCRLAEQLIQPSNAQGAAEAFKQHDTDGSGYLEIGELCKALRSMPELHLSGWEIRLLLAYLFHYGDTNKDLRLSVVELQTSLAPFVPRPPAEELQRVYQTYEASRNLPGLLQAVHRLQPALLPAACAQAAAASASTDSAVNQVDGTAPSTDKTDARVFLSSLSSVIAAVAPGVVVPPEEIAQLQQLIVLDYGIESLPATELVNGIILSAHAIKRAAAISRMVADAQEDHTPVYLEAELGSAEIVLQRLSDMLVEDEGARIVSAFEAFDKDGSGYLDGPELCAAMHQVQALITAEELRTLLAYVQKYADNDTNGRVSLQELQALLKPFQ